jgi:AraC-like DNA-binding protein
MDALTELRANTARHAKAGTTSPDLPRLRCTISTKRTEPTSGTDDSWLGLIVQGAKRTVIGSRTFEFGAGDFLVASVSVPVTRQVTQAPCILVGLRLQPSLVASLLLRDPGPRKRETPFAFATSKASDEILDAFRRYVRLLDAPEDIPVLGDAIEREILWRVMQSPHGAALREIGLASSNLALISRAIDLLQRRFTEPLEIAELARVAHMSTATFNRHFRRVTMMSPLQFQKQLRLQAARAQLLARTGDVASVGFAVGYQSPSQFSREYRRQFGLPPGEEAARLRKRVG